MKPIQSLSRCILRGRGLRPSCLSACVPLCILPRSETVSVLRNLGLRVKAGLGFRVSGLGVGFTGFRGRDLKSRAENGEWQGLSWACAEDHLIRTQGAMSREADARHLLQNSNSIST